jgi:hypothetical protein
MQDGDCLYVVKEQPADGQLVELVKEAKKKKKLLRQADETTLDSAQYVSVVNMDDDDPDAVYSMLHYLYTQQIPSAPWFGYTSWGGGCRALSSSDWPRRQVRLVSVC